MAQKWVWPFRRGKKNLEKIAPGIGLLHDVGFSGAKTYRAVKIDEQNRAHGGGSTQYKRADALRDAKEMGRDNPARKNPSAKSLIGATILSIKRTAKGVFIKARKKPTATTRKNPTSRPWKVWGYRRVGGWKALSPGYATRAAAVQVRDKHRPTQAMPYIQVYDARPTRKPV